LGFLDAFSKSPTKKLEADAEKNPSPEAFALLAQKHIEMGEMDVALQVADRALQTFKNSQKLKDIVSFIRKKQSQGQVRHLQDEIRVKPSPNVYTQLAGIMRDLGDVDHALDLLTECAEKFGSDPVAFRMIGQIRLEHFLHEVIAYDGIHALEAIQKAKSLAAEDSGARMLAAQLYYAVGANALAVRELKAELDRNATALDIKSFLEDIGNPGALEDGTTAESLIERCEETGSLVNSLQGFPRVKPGLAQRTGATPKINPVAAMAKAQEIAGTPGVVNLVILDREGRAVASVRGENPLDGEAFRELAHAVERVAYEACRRMDIGSFVKGSCLVPGGGVAFVRRRGTTFAMLFTEPMKADRAAVFLEDFVSKIVGGGHGA
jgi:tetratricopeptide (TPR) repeat protein